MNILAHIFLKIIFFWNIRKMEVRTYFNQQLSTSSVLFCKVIELIKKARDCWKVSQYLMSNSNMVIHNSTLLNTAVRNSQISDSSVIGGDIGVGSNPPLGGWRPPNPNTWEPKQHWNSRHKNYLRQPQEMFPSSGFTPYQYVSPISSLQSASRLTW